MKDELQYFGVDRKEDILTIGISPLDWRTPIIRYLKEERTCDVKDLMQLESIARFYFMIDRDLCKKTFLPADAKCLTERE